MAEKLLQWHPGFHAAIRIELQEEAETLEFYSEHELSKKPLRIDTLVVKKLDDKPIQKNIGKIFRGHNLIEYKNPGDSLNINDFYRAYGYACIYQSDTQKVREIRMDDITITFICSHYPREILKILKEERGIEVEKKEDGIYWLKNDPVPMQIILNHRLSRKENPWLGSLRADLQVDEDTDQLLRDYSRNKESNLYQAAMDLIIRANWKTMEEVRFVCDALRELYADELEAERIKGEERGEARGIELGEARGIELGAAKEGKRLTALIQRLLGENLLDDLKRVSEDRTYCEQMYRKYGL